MSAPLLTDVEVARRLNCSVRHVRRLRDQRKLACVRIGRIVRTPLEALEGLIEDATQPALEVADEGNRIVLRAVRPTD